MIDYILHATGASKVGYVGHSQGTTMMFASLSWNPALSAKLTTFVALAPVVSVSDIQVQFLNLLAKYYIDDLFGLFGADSFLPEPPLIMRMYWGLRIEFLLSR